MKSCVWVMFLNAAFGLAGAVQTPKHGPEGVGQRQATQAKRGETALLMAPSLRQNRQCCATNRNLR
ncbi:hypothetical protein ARTHRO8AJ_60103 [Arthrobacter sp. 8AJ]|nr:hypothetical protein ARTHRO8AJ_60103 [Arthrobacter sp. 8AJ]